MVSFGDNVRWARTYSRLSQTALAELVRVNRHHASQSYISKLEGGRADPRLSTIRSLARALHLKPWQLVADISENVDFWEGYMRLSAQGKRDIQRTIAWMLERGK
jgi:transcriptional regulator with XRE-family HTH domain